MRASESEVRHIKVKGHSRKIHESDANIRALENQLEEKFGTKVSVKGTLRKGKVVIEYFSKEELDDLCNL